MTPFEHLAVLISIVLGMGIAHLLNNVRELAQARGRVRPYWLPLLWLFLLFVSLIEWWWASFSLRTTLRWNFFYFLFVLMSPISMYLAATFVLPDNVQKDEVIDLRQYYYDNAGWLFGTLAVSPALDCIRRGIEAGSFLNSGAVSNGISAVLVASMAKIKKPWYHGAITLIVAALFVSFIVSSALELR